MKRGPLLYSIVALGVVAIAFALNPSPERHREAIRDAVAERSPLAGMLGVGAITAFASHYHPLGVASYTTFDGELVSIGAFGMVFVFNPADG